MWPLWPVSLAGSAWLVLSTLTCAGTPPVSPTKPIPLPLYYNDPTCGGSLHEDKADPLQRPETSPLSRHHGPPSS